LEDNFTQEVACLAITQLGADKALRLHSLPILFYRTFWGDH